MNNKNNKQENYKKVSCPNCNSLDVIKRGYFQTQVQGKQQRYYCKSCNKKFIEQTAFYRMRNNPQKITLCLDLFYRGISTRKVQEHLQAFYPHNSSHKTIYQWVVKYAKLISNFTNGLKLNVGKEMQIDEMQYSRRKYPNRKGIEMNWFIDTIDTKTRFIVSSEYTKTRKQSELKKVLRTAKEKTGKQIEICTSDGYTAYEDAIRNIFCFNRQTHKCNVLHKKVTQLKGEGFNIMIERLHNNIRQRTKTFRGFHGSIESANAIMKGWEIYYNFITKHQALNKCPYELATNLKLNSENKWLELINLSSN
jgi:transposase-like protein